MLRKQSFWKRLTFFQVKLHCISIYNNIKWYARRNCRPDFQQWTELADSYLANHILDILFRYYRLLNLCYKHLHSDFLFKYSTICAFANAFTKLFWFEIQIEHFDIDAKLTNSHSVFGYHCVIVNVKKVDG
jgi:hypothetical protein